MSCLLLFFTLIFSDYFQGLPPGTVKINDSLYVDETEIRNIDWRECLYWNRKTFGETSDEYLFMLPDSLKWTNTDITFEHYFRHPRYQDFPVVCISYEQALRYCKWRSDRVNEGYYMKVNKIKYTEMPDFSKINVPSYVTYRLPSAEEWEAAAANTDPAYSNFSTSLPVSPKKFRRNKFGLIHIAGNVSEMIADKGKAKGGNFNTTSCNFDIKTDINYECPAIWLGFRCVCVKN